MNEKFVLIGMGQAKSGLHWLLLPVSRKGRYASFNSRGKRAAARLEVEMPRGLQKGGVSSYLSPIYLTQWLRSLRVCFGLRVDKTTPRVNLCGRILTQMYPLQ